MIHHSILLLYTEHSPRVSPILTTSTATAHVLSLCHPSSRLLQSSLFHGFRASVSVHCCIHSWSIDAFPGRRAPKLKPWRESSYKTEVVSVADSDWERGKSELFCSKLNYVFIHCTNTLMLSMCLAASVNKRDNSLLAWHLYSSRGGENRKEIKQVSYRWWEVL